jgi:hypothetical protein
MAHLDAVERVADYDVPVDPMELTICESCE